MCDAVAGTGGARVPGVPLSIKNIIVKAHATRVRQCRALNSAAVYLQ